MPQKWIEVKVRIVEDNYKETVEVYSQKLNYAYFERYRPHLIPEITEVVNRAPNIEKVPAETYNIDVKSVESEFDRLYREYHEKKDLHKDKN